MVTYRDQPLAAVDLYISFIWNILEKLVGLHELQDSLDIQALVVLRGFLVHGLYRKRLKKYELENEIIAEGREYLLN